METEISPYLLSPLILLLLDVMWIKLWMGKQYEGHVRAVQGSEMKVRPIFAVLAYVLMIVGMNLFVLPRIRENNEFQDSLKYAFTFGIVLYGVYDFTAAAVLKNWDVKLALVDVLWGGFVYFVAAYVGSKFGKK